VAGLVIYVIQYNNRGVRPNIKTGILQYGVTHHHYIVALSHIGRHRA
jgi:hypothetical protein